MPNYGEKWTVSEGRYLICQACGAGVTLAPRMHRWFYRSGETFYCEECDEGETRFTTACHVVHNSDEVSKSENVSRETND